MLKEALKEENINSEPQLILIDSEASAKKFKFYGSPNIKINNKDIDPFAESVTNYGLGACRPYLWEGQMFDFPPKEMILTALQEHIKPSG